MCIVFVKSGCSLRDQGQKSRSFREDSCCHPLVFAETLPREVLAGGRNIHPQASLPADRTRAINGKPNKVRRLRWSGQIYVASWNVWSTLVGQGKKMNHLRGLCLLGSHDTRVNGYSEVKLEASQRNTLSYSDFGDESLEKYDGYKPQTGVS